ncbi:zinc finger, CCHC-type containing protein [Tanacetum coccineum]
MAAATMKHMALNFSKLDKFEGVDFRRWQKKMHFLLSSMSVVYVLTTPIPEDGGDDATVEQIRKRAKWDNDDYVYIGLILNGMSDSLFDIYQNVKSSKELWDSLEAKYMVEDASNFKHTLKHNKEELTLAELGSHLCIEESLRAHDSDKLNDNNIIAFMSTSRLNDSILWHTRLGHVHFNRMQDMSKDGLILAFDMDTEKCKTCMLIKITKKPFQNVKHKIEVLELIYSDLYDLHATPSSGNKKYFVTFIDDASRFCYVYLLHSKDEALDKFKVFKTKVELQQGSLIKRFRTDRGGGYMDTLYFQSVSIIHETAAPYTPQQICISKRKNRVLKEMVNFMLFYSGLNQRLWGERGIECIFVGYAEHSKSFRFFVIEPNESVSINSIIESRDAIFDENRFSSVPKPSLRIPNGTEDIGGSVVPEEVTKEDEVSNQHSYFFNVEDDTKTFDEAMKSHDVTFWKEAIKDEMDSIMGNNT